MPRDDNAWKTQPRSEQKMSQGEEKERSVTREGQKEGAVSGRTGRVQAGGLDVPQDVVLQLCLVLVSLGCRRHWIHFTSLNGVRDWKNKWEKECKCFREQAQGHSYWWVGVCKEGGRGRDHCFVPQLMLSGATQTTVSRQTVGVFWVLEEEIMVLYVPATPHTSHHRLYRDSCLAGSCKAIREETKPVIP